MIKVLEEGFNSIVLDLGREGYFRYGISPSGVLDEYSFRLGNIFLGNKENTPQIEINIFGPTLEFLEDKIISIFGGEIEAYLNGNRINMYEPIFVKKGSILFLKEVKTGLRSYLIIQGGISVEKFLGSASYDKYLNKGIKLKKGNIIKIDSYLNKEVLKRFFPDNFKRDFNQNIFRVILGPDEDRFLNESIEMFFKEFWEISERSDRSAIRLLGEPLKFKEGKETIISEGVNTGTIQVPQNGLPIILLKDRPTTGGYPKIGNVIKVDISILSQKRFKEKIKFERVSLDDAHKILKEMEEKIEKFKEILGVIKNYYIIFNNKKYFIKIEEIEDEKSFNQYWLWWKFFNL